MSFNILNVVLDDMGTEQLAVFGPGLAPDQQPSMPTLNRLAQQGVRFLRSYMQPICSPARAEIFTGAYGFRTGIGTLAEYTQQPLLDREVCLPAALKAATANGYACAQIGKHHLSTFQSLGGEAEHPIHCGFDFYCGTLRNMDGGENYYNWTETTAERGANGGIRVRQALRTQYTPLRQMDVALEWIRKQDGPWFLNYTTNLPHPPYNRPPADLYDTSRWSLPDFQAPGVDASARPYYKAMEEAADTILGHFLSLMDQRTRANTIIFVWPDNGTPNEVVDQAYIDAGLSGHFKRSVYQPGTQTPLIVCGAGVAGGGRTTSAIVKSVDLFATFIDLAGGDIGLVPAPVGHIRDSTSFAPVLRGETDEARQYAWCDLFSPNGPHTLCSVVGSRAISFGRYKLMRNGGSGVVFPSGTGGAINGTDALFDLALDELEMQNLIGVGSPFVSGGIINLVDGDATHPGILTAYNTAKSTWASLTASL